MRTIKIRFIEYIEKDKPSKFSMQYKRWYGWSYVGYWMGGYGGSCWEQCYDDSKENLLKNAFEIYFERPASRVNIIEYPTIKKY